jgi:uncharacterized lipoprotein YbaY
MSTSKAIAIALAAAFALTACSREEPKAPPPAKTDKEAMQQFVKGNGRTRVRTAEEIEAGEKAKEAASASK